GEAATIVEQGKAQAMALKALVEEYKKAGSAAREVLVFQKLLPLVGAISGGDKRVVIRKLTVLPVEQADGSSGSWARKAIATAEQLRAATGIDVGAMAKKLSAPTIPP